jgi:hypothetical protein
MLRLLGTFLGNPFAALTHRAGLPWEGTRHNRGLQWQAAAGLAAPGFIRLRVEAVSCVDPSARRGKCLDAEMQTQLNAKNAAAKTQAIGSVRRADHDARLKADAREHPSRQE